MPDKTVEADVEFVFGEPGNVPLESREVEIEGGTRHEVTLRDANPFDIRFEIEFAGDVGGAVRTSGKLIARPGTLAPRWGRVSPPSLLVRPARRHGGQLG